MSVVCRGGVRGVWGGDTGWLCVRDDVAEMTRGTVVTVISVALVAVCDGGGTISIRGSGKIHGPFL